MEEVVKEDWEKEQDARDASHWTTPQFDQRYYDEMCRRVKFKNSELHSLRYNCKNIIPCAIALIFLNNITFVFTWGRF